MACRILLGSLDSLGGGIPIACFVVHHGVRIPVTHFRLNRLEVPNLIVRGYYVMANFDGCINWVLRFEDSTLSGRVVVLADGAGRTRFGIAEKDHPGLPGDFYMTDAASALVIAKAIYRAQYWNPLCGDSLVCDELAASLLSFAVNDGERFDAKMFQRILGITPDGCIGPATVAAANAANGSTLAAALRTAQAAHYRAVAVANPSEAQYLGSVNPPRGWLGRAAAIYTGT